LPQWEVETPLHLHLCLHRILQHLQKINSQDRTRSHSIVRAPGVSCFRCRPCSYQYRSPGFHRSPTQRLRPAPQRQRQRRRRRATHRPL